jgi:hypothetical protein
MNEDRASNGAVFRFSRLSSRIAESPALLKSMASEPALSEVEWVQQPVCATGLQRLLKESLAFEGARL